MKRYQVEPRAGGVYVVVDMMNGRESRNYNYIDALSLRSWLNVREAGYVS